VPYLSVLEVCSRQGAIQIHVYLYFYTRGLYQHHFGGHRYGMHCPYLLFLFAFHLCRLEIPSSSDFKECCEVLITGWEPKLNLAHFGRRLDPTVRTTFVKFARETIQVCGLAMTLTFDLLWPWKPFQQWPLAWWIFVPSFIEIHPLSTEISRYA